jgi:hypothetical protein
MLCGACKKKKKVNMNINPYASDCRVRMKCRDINKKIACVRIVLRWNDDVQEIVVKA